MTLFTGQTLAYYEILGPLGAGAMGEVYRARDTRLGREVALKVIPDELAGDEERLRRFEREARTLACLSHPNVAHVYGIDQVEGTCFMAMELVAGEDLARRLARGPLRVDEALKVCRQVAEGLEAAHESGVMHRDLKPANVIVAPDGRVKILDFGLAKPIRGAEGTAADDSLLTTEAGRVLGTPTYMAPEQARGRAIDKRADVWAFGCVLYECLTGRRAFGGETVTDVLAAVLEREPDLSRLPGATPPRVRELLERCLDKDPRTRLRDVGEARVLLRRPGSSGAEHASPGARPRAVAAALAVAIAGIAALAWSLARSLEPAPARPAVVTPRRLTEMVGMEEMPAVSPDGEKVAFVSRVDGRRQVFLRLLETGASTQLTDGPYDHVSPRWAGTGTLVYVRTSPDGGEPSSLWTSDYFGSQHRLVRGGVGDEVDVDLRSGRIAGFHASGNDAELFVAADLGAGEERRFPLPPANYASPRWSPDGTRIAFATWYSLSAAEIRVLDVVDGTTHPVVQVQGAARGLAWLPDGSGLVYASSLGSTVPYPPVFRLRAVKVDGSGDTGLPCDSAGYASYVEPDVTPDGELVASRIAMQSDVYRVPVGPDPRKNVVDALRITYQTGLVQVPTASPRGDEVAYISDSGGHANVWVASADGTGRTRKVTFDGDPLTFIGSPMWSPRDGDWINYWRGVPGGPAEEWLVHPDGSGAVMRVRCRGGASWSPDGKWLYYIAYTDDPGKMRLERVSVDDLAAEPELVREGAGAVLVASDGVTGYVVMASDYADMRTGQIYRIRPIETGTPELVADLSARFPLWPHMYSLSPDDAWLATPLLDDGTTNLWIVSTADGSLRQVTDFGRRSTMIARQVSWSPDGESIYAAVMESDADIVLLAGAL